MSSRPSNYQLTPLGNETSTKCESSLCRNWAIWIWRTGSNGCEGQAEVSFTWPSSDLFLAISGVYLLRLRKTHTHSRNETLRKVILDHCLSTLHFNAHMQFHGHYCQNMCRKLVKTKRVSFQNFNKNYPNGYCNFNNFSLGIVIQPEGGEKLTAW